MVILRSAILIQRLFIVAALLSAPILAAAQSQYSAERAPVSFTVGGSFSFFDAGYGGYKVMGPVANATFSPVIWDHVALEAEGRWLTLNGSRGFSGIQLSHRSGLPHHSRGAPRPASVCEGTDRGRASSNSPIIWRWDAISRLRPGAVWMSRSIAAGGCAPTTNTRSGRSHPVFPASPATMKPNGVSVGFTYRVF